MKTLDEGKKIYFFRSGGGIYLKMNKIELLTFKGDKNTIEVNMLEKFENWEMI